MDHSSYTDWEQWESPETSKRIQWIRASTVGDINSLETYIYMLVDTLGSQVKYENDISVKDQQCV